MKLPQKKEIDRDPLWHELALLWISLEKLERIKKKLALKVAQLLQYQRETWSWLPRNKKARLNKKLSWIAEIVLERMKWRKIWEKICRTEIAAFMWKEI